MLSQNYAESRVMIHNLEWIVIHPIYFIRNLIFGEGFRFLNYSILKASPSLIHRNPFLNFKVQESYVFENFCYQFFSFGFLILSVLKPCRPSFFSFKALAKIFIINSIPYKINWM